MLHPEESPEKPDIIWQPPINFQTTSPFPSILEKLTPPFPLNFSGDYKMLEYVTYFLALSISI